MIRQLAFLCTIGIFLLNAGCSSTANFHISTLKNSTDLEKRREAAFQLSICKKLDQKMLPTLIETFKDSDVIVREFTIKTIGQMDPHIEGVPQAIKDGLRDTSVAVRRASAAIFSTMNPVPLIILGALAEALCDQDSLTRSYIKSTFIDLGSIGVNALVTACKNSNESLRINAATTLGTIGFDAKRALPTLIELLQDNNKQVRVAAQQSIALIQHSKAYSRKS